MLLKVKALHLLAGRPIAILHEEIARYLNLHVGERIKIKRYGKKKEIVAPVDLTGGKTILNKDEIALSQEIFKNLKLRSKEIIEISPALKPLSVSFIHKKLDGQTLTFTEIYSIISDIVNNELTEAEVAFFVSSVYLQGMNFDEIASMTKAMVKTGYQLKFDKPITIDKHSIGGVEGNRTTPLVVSIIASAIDQLKLKAVMPKTSSRAITSAAGTADVIETLAKIDFSINEIKDIVKKTNACLVWGGSLGLAPADDKIIQIERILSLDPEAQLLASILSKKLSVNASHVLIDISYGKGAKMSNRSEAEKLKHKFEKIAKKLNLNIIVALTDGTQPVGNGIGTILEMKDVLAILKQDKDRPIDLENRALYLSTKLLSFVTGMSEKQAYIVTKGILISGEAYKKFEQIIEAQRGSLRNIENKLRLGKFKQDMKAKQSGILKEISNKKMARIARLAGSPADKSAGIYLNKHIGDKVKKKETLFTIYAETLAKLHYAQKVAERVMPMVVG
ncbi:MAG: thymidine phosphorylase [Candidatus Pacearchaeota archaeon]|nr:MAG: thymidine phosphorylase [Candidatus Pacearchaeota archaeon]